MDWRRRRMTREIESYQDPAVRRRSTIMLVVGFTLVILFFIAVATIGS